MFSYLCFHFHLFKFKPNQEKIKIKNPQINEAKYTPNLVTGKNMVIYVTMYQMVCVLEARDV
jgi:hypothetical protein